MDTTDQNANGEADLAPADGVKVLLATAPPDKAREIAAALVGEGLAACVNLVPGVRSVYRWQGTVHDDPETLLVLKTVPARVAALARRLRELHPYDVPELLSIGPEMGLARYLGWVAETAGGD